MTDSYDEHVEAKKRRRAKGPKRRNPIASTHGKGGFKAGPMLSKKDRTTRKRIKDVDFDDYG